MPRCYMKLACHKLCKQCVKICRTRNKHFFPIGKIVEKSKLLFFYNYIFQIFSRYKFHLLEKGKNLKYRPVTRSKNVVLP